MYATDLTPIQIFPLVFPLVHIGKVMQIDALKEFGKFLWIAFLLEVRREYCLHWHAQNVQISNSETAILLLLSCLIKMYIQLILLLTYGHAYSALATYSTMRAQPLSLVHFQKLVLTQVCHYLVWDIVNSLYPSDKKCVFFFKRAYLPQPWGWFVCNPSVINIPNWDAYSVYILRLN